MMAFVSDELVPARKAQRRGLNRLAGLRHVLVSLRRFWLVHVFGMDISSTAQLSLSAKLDRTFPIGVHIGAHSYVAFDAVILTHDRTRGIYAHTSVGENCFVGARSVILPGVSVGDGSIVAAGAIVSRDVPDDTMVAGNPARVIKSNLGVGPYGRLPEADLTEHRLSEAGLT